MHIIRGRVVLMLLINVLQYMELFATAWPLKTTSRFGKT